MQASNKPIDGKFFSRPARQCVAQINYAKCLLGKSFPCGATIFEVGPDQFAAAGLAVGIFNRSYARDERAVPPPPSRENHAGVVAA
jgi:hypothetical protein